MKRPNGFPPPAPPEDAISVEAPAAPKPPKLPKPPRSVKPIRPQTAAAEPEAPGADGAATPPVRKKPLRAESASTAPARESSTHEIVSPSRARRDEALARKNVRIAERKRRRYERSEARRFTERARRRRLTWLISGGALVGLVLIVLVTAYSPLFAVRSVDIEGTSRIDAAQVQTALSDQLGKPLALVDYGAIKQELSSFTLIQSYSTESQLPNTLVIQIVERQPVGSVASASGAGFDLVDAAGVVIAHSDQRASGYPLIDLSGGPIGSPGFLGATAVLRSLPAELLAKVDSVSAATPDSVTLVLAGAGQKVIWGSVDNSALKAKVLDKLIGTQNPDATLTYDVSSPDSPVVS